jgi:hypothetical protein
VNRSSLRLRNVERLTGGLVSNSDRKFDVWLHMAGACGRLARLAGKIRPHGEVGIPTSSRHEHRGATGSEISVWGGDGINLQSITHLVSLEVERDRVIHIQPQFDPK